ncbi:hypothetical protein FB567DRAFT_520160 [Paraphoma chrysanthemicola]|uniref:Secreted protein n=1 Tax=Paraphoma chrysanthemicola TaxID=798071 RepID=A0A8K0RAC4_9PLEO|nr:hypothetical protein FB567DRAFT_520160 [Paraphoma chrysanthemicola]
MAAGLRASIWLSAALLHWLRSSFAPDVVPLVLVVAVRCSSSSSAGATGAPAAFVPHLRHADSKLAASRSS